MTDFRKEEDSSTVVLPPAPRDDMVNKAVDFLLNPKVQQSPLSQRKAFLLKKGLTQEEVDLAVSRSGVTDNVAMATHQPPTHGPVVQYQPAPVSTWSKWKDFLSTAVLVGGLSYALYQFIRKYILPIWFGPTKEERQMAALEMSINQLQRSLEELVGSMKTIQASVDAQSENVKQAALESAQLRGSAELQKMQESNGISDIKQELVSLKGLLLSRKQFPPTPATQPVIPSWQLASRSDVVSVTTTATTSAAMTTTVTMAAAMTTTVTTTAVDTTAAVTTTAASVTDTTSTCDTSLASVVTVSDTVTDRHNSTQLTNGSDSDSDPQQLSAKTSSFVMVDQGQRSDGIEETRSLEDQMTLTGQEAETAVSEVKSEHNTLEGSA